MRWTFRSALAGLVLALTVAPPALGAQQHSRFSVLIPDLLAADGSNKKFGENVAKVLRERLNTLLTHQSVSKKDLDSALKEHKVDGSKLNCALTRQLASLMGSQLALCASYAQRGDQWVVDAEFVDVRSGESFTVSETTVAEGGEGDAAEHIFGEFDRYTQQIRSAGVCAEYAVSRAWNMAMPACDKALELNPDAISTRYIRARIYFETDEPDRALSELKLVLEANPVHEDALQLAGYVSAKQGQDDEALAYYTRYLELSPGSAAVRMKVAYELAQAGDPAGAMHLIQEGLDRDADNVDLWEQLGGFAFAAGQRINDESRSAAEDANTVVPDAVSYFRTAIDAYTKVFETKGSDTPPNELRSIVAAYVMLGELNEAVALGARVLETHPEEPGLWSVYADALQRSGKLADALTALERVRELDPQYPNVGLRQGKWLLDAGRTREAAAALKALATADPAQADAAGRMVLAQAYAQGVQPKKWPVAIEALDAARGIPGMGAETTQQINFWLGYSLLQGSITEQEARTVETAQATLPKFQRARQLFGEVGNYPSKVNVNLADLLQAVDQYIEIQESIIKRG
jgi:tetratricopeptide (TPR) repeat protein